MDLLPDSKALSYVAGSRSQASLSLQSAAPWGEEIYAGQPIALCQSCWGWEGEGGIFLSRAVQGNDGVTQKQKD